MLTIVSLLFFQRLDRFTFSRKPRLLRSTLSRLTPCKYFKDPTNWSGAVEAAISKKKKYVTLLKNFHTNFHFQSWLSNRYFPYLLSPKSFSLSLSFFHRLIQCCTYFLVGKLNVTPDPKLLFRVSDYLKLSAVLVQLQVKWNNITLLIFIFGRFVYHSYDFIPVIAYNIFNDFQWTCILILLIIILLVLSSLDI